MAAGRKNNDLTGDMDIMNDLMSFNKPKGKEETKNQKESAKEERSALSGKKKLIHIYLDEVDKEAWNSFFSKNRMSLSDGVRRAVEYFINHVNNGDIELN